MSAAVIEDLYERAFAPMDKTTGMFPEEWRCIRCDKVLNADGHHPAELYAGTYNGLCYPCTSAGEFLVETLEDGCQVWSYPPHCPSWRRDRETFFGFPDCEHCNGSGVSGWGRSFGGGNYRKHCTDCMARHTKRGAYDTRDVFSREDLDPEERILRAYTEAVGHEPPTPFEPGTLAHEQWAYTGKGTKAKRAEALLRFAA